MFISVLIPDLPIQIERKRNLALTSILIADMDRGTVFAASPDVRESGVEAGMSLHRAQQIAPFAQIVEADETAYDDYQNTVYAVLSEGKQKVEIVALGEFLLEWKTDRHAEISDYDQKIRLLLAAVREAAKLEVQIGVATYRFTAQQAARRVTDDGVFVVRKGKDKKFLAPFPVAALPDLPPDLVARLHDFKIYTLIQLAELPKAAFMLQFGTAFAYLHDLASGQDQRPLSPTAPPLRFLQVRHYKQPVEGSSAIVRQAKAITAELCERVAASGYQAEAFKLTVTFADGRINTIAHPLKPPTADAERLGWYISQLLEEQDIQEPVAHIGLVAYPVRPFYESMRQLSLFAAATETKQEQFENALRQMKRRFGEHCVRVASQIEPPKPTPIHVQTAANGKPEALIEVDGLRWISRIEEVWREESGWWDIPSRRDYFRVILSDGTHRNLFFDAVSQEWFLDRAWYASLQRAA